MSTAAKSSLAVAVVVVVAAFWWTSAPEPGPAPPQREIEDLATNRGGDARVDASETPVGALSDDRSLGSGSGARPVSDRRTAVTSTKKGAVGNSRIEVAFLDVANRTVRPRESIVRVEKGDAIVAELHAHDSETVMISGLVSGPCDVHVRAEGFDDGQSFVDAVEGSDATRCTVCLTSRRSIAVLVVDAAGRSIKEWSQEWGGEPKHFFHGCFHAYMSDRPQNGGSHGTSVRLESVATAKEQGCIPLGCVGVVDRPDGTDTWIGLDYLGAELGWGHAGPEDRQVQFTVDPVQLAGRLARLRFRVLRGESLEPAPESTVVLLSDSSKHRRKEQAVDLHPDAQGWLTFSNLVPEEYELRIERRGAGFTSEFVNRLVLAPGEQRELGEIRLGADPPFRVRVVDAAGVAVTSAVVQIGPFTAGADAETVYSIHGQPRVWRTDSEGRVELPFPSYAAVLRAGREPQDPRNFQFSGPWSRNVLLGPSHTTEVTLVIEDPSTIEFIEDPRVEGMTAEVTDEAGIVVERRKLDRSPSWTLDVASGVYSIAVLDPSGRRISQKQVRVAGSRTTVSLP